MRPLYRDQMHLWRASGLDIFVLPCPGPVEGEAFTGLTHTECGRRGTLNINITGSPRSPYWLFVLLHEVAHHALRHTSVRSTVPQWLIEYDASRWALRMIRRLQPGLVEKADRYAAAHIRPLLQSMIDLGIHNHVDRRIAKWAGCDLSALDEEMGEGGRSGVGSDD